MKCWFKGSIIYSLIVGTFHDESSDGCVYFKGLRDRLKCLYSGRDLTGK